MALTPEQEAALVNGGVCHLHTHDDERLLNHRDLEQLNSVKRPTVVSTDYTAAYQDDIILVDTSGGAVSITLPGPRGGNEHVIIRVAGANSVTITPESGLVDGAASASVSASYTPKRLKSIAGDYYSV